MVTIEPARKLGALELMTRGEILARCGRAVVANLAYDIARREIAVVAEKTEWSDRRAATMNGSIGPGNVVMLEAACERVTEVVTAFGTRGVRAEDVAATAVDEMQGYLQSNAAVGEHLADQLLLPMAIGEGGAFTTVRLTEHTRTNGIVVGSLLGERIAFEEEGGGWRVKVGR